MQRIALALAIGLFVGLDREHQGKEAGLRTFALVALMGCVAALVGDNFAILGVALTGVLVLILNVQTIRKGAGSQLTTSVALLVAALAGVMAGLGQTLLPASIGIVVAAVLAWKKPLHEFSLGLTDSELRSAILLAILAFVIYPLLPVGFVDPWNLIDLRAAWLIVILIAGIGFVNYILLRKYGEKGIEVAGFLGGVVNATLTTAEIATLDRVSGAGVSDVAYVGIMLATIASVLRNAVLLAVLALSVLVSGMLAFVMMSVGGALLLLQRYMGAQPRPAEPSDKPLLKLSSPFSITSALKYGVLFLCIQIAGELAQRVTGRAGFYVVSMLGGFVSSASAVASAALLAAHGTITPQVAAVGAVLATVVSILFNITFVARISNDMGLTRRVGWRMGVIAFLGVVGALLQSVLISANRSF
ncbi:MAG: DUF4010 domain-containing protein [Gemmatimonadota bacterium]|nr:DUF4010 domain-containing protein [Gemmatimonadota bacterium]